MSRGRTSPVRLAALKGFLEMAGQKARNFSPYQREISAKLARKIGNRI
jgi:hypothetical protein